MLKLKSSLPYVCILLITPCGSYPYDCRIDYAPMLFLGLSLLPCIYFSVSSVFLIMSSTSSGMNGYAAILFINVSFKPSF